MKQLCLIAGSVLTIGLMSACNLENETHSSQIGSSEAQKNMMEAEQAEMELAKLAELQKHEDSKATKGHQQAGRVAKNGRMPASEHAAPAPAKHEEKKASKKVATKKPEGHAPEAPQEVAKKELAADHATNVGAVAALNHAPAAPVAHHPKADGGAVKSSVYVVQVGSFRVKENAVKLEEKLKTSGFPVRMKEVNHSKNGLLYVVQFEPTPNKSEADTWRSQVKAKASLDAQLVTRQD